MRRSLLLGLLVALVATSAAGAASWKPFRALKLIVNDSVDALGHVYSASGHFLAEPGDAGVAYLLSPKDYTVHRVDVGSIERVNEVPQVSLDDKSAYQPAGLLERDGGTLSWSDGGVRYALSAKPPLIGEVTLEQLRAHTKKYEADIESYVPEPGVVAALSGVEGQYRFVVGFGTWCSVCARWLPRFVKTLEAADNESFTSTYVSMSESLEEPAAALEHYQLDEVPTFVVLRDGKEIGRLSGEALDDDPDARLEAELLGIISGR